MQADEVHHVHIGNFGNNTVVACSRRNVGAESAHQDSGAGSGRTDACADHHWDEGCTHGSGTAGCRRNGNVDEACDDGGGGD